MTDDEDDVEVGGFEVGDEVFVEGEWFTVTQKLENVAALTPRNENGSGRLEWETDWGYYIFTRRRGVDTTEITIREADQ